MKLHGAFILGLCSIFFISHPLSANAEEQLSETFPETVTETQLETTCETVVETTESNTFTNEEVYQFVERMYRIVLKRDPDHEGVQNWYNSLISGQNVGSDIVLGFFLSQEFQNFHHDDETYIRILYRALFDREADPAGLENWLSAREAGVSDHYLIAGFIGSQEYQTMCSRFGILPGTIVLTENRDMNLNITRFVNHFYRNCQGRSADIAGLNDWTGGLIDGRYNGVTIVQGFLYSPEFINKQLDSASFIEVLYQTLLCRSSDPAGQADWITRLENGTSQEQIIAGFVNSIEFNELCNTYGIERGHMPLDMPAITTSYTIPDLSKKALSTFNCENTISEETQAEINALIKNISANNVGFVLVDLMSGKGISYNAEKRFFSASTIKGPYVACINEKIPSSRDKHASAMEKTIKVSNNQTYGTLKNTYGGAVFSEWLNEAGCGWVNTRSKYTNITSKSLAQMWIRMYTYLRSNQANAEWCKNLFISTKESFISESLGSTYTVYSKAGWTYYNIRNDGGIILKEDSPYVLAILSNKYHKKAELVQLVQILDRAHSELIQ